MVTTGPTLTDRTERGGIIDMDIIHLHDTVEKVLQSHRRRRHMVIIFNLIEDKIKNRKISRGSDQTKI